MSIFQWLVSALAILVAAQIIPGVDVDLLGALILAIVLALINVFLKPFVMLLTLPINIVTLGLFSLIINAFLILFADLIVPGFSVAGFWSAFFFSIVVSLITALFGIVGNRR